ncbi:MAG: antitoxin family protein [Candidatus Methanoperedens sp.]|nr:antitoxin family protein [Candidatus Methanoperedens sp.]
MSEAIPAIYEDGKFKPLQRVNLPEHKHVHLILIPEEEAALLKSQNRELSKIVGIGKCGKTDVARKHDKYLY